VLDVEVDPGLLGVNPNFNSKVNCTVQQQVLIIGFRITRKILYRLTGTRIFNRRAAEGLIFGLDS
jgi:hypothetical protein